MLSVRSIMGPMDKFATTAIPSFKTQELAHGRISISPAVPVPGMFLRAVACPKSVVAGSLHLPNHIPYSPPSFKVKKLFSQSQIREVYLQMFRCDIDPGVLVTHMVNAGPSAASFAARGIRCVSSYLYHGASLCCLLCLRARPFLNQGSPYLLYAASEKLPGARTAMRCTRER